MLRALSLCTCACRHYPGYAAAGCRLRSSHPAVTAFPDNVVRVGLPHRPFRGQCSSVHSRCGPRHSRGHPICDLLHRRLQPFCHLHDCSFRLLPAGTFRRSGACTHWNAPPCHGAHVKRTLQREKIERPSCEALVVLFCTLPRQSWPKTTGDRNSGEARRLHRSAFAPISAIFVLAFALAFPAAHLARSQTAAPTMTVDEAREENAYAIGLQAYLWGFPLYYYRPHRAPRPSKLACSLR